MRHLRPNDVTLPVVGGSSSSDIYHPHSTQETHDRTLRNWVRWYTAVGGKEDAEERASSAM